MIFETHAHYDDEKFDEDRAELLSSMQENGIGRIINVSANLESLENTRKLMEAYPFIYGAFGLHLYRQQKSFFIARTEKLFHIYHIMWKR